MYHSARDRRLPLLAAGLALLFVAWIVIPSGPRPPLYDGVGFPDEPYRYVDPPRGNPATPPPTDAVDTEPANSTILSVWSGEEASQVQANIPTDILILPAGATSVTMRFRPLAPAPPLPTDGVIWGNVYRLTLTSPQGPVGLKPSNDPAFYIELRAPAASQPPPVMEAYVHGTWHRLPTNQDGNDIYGAQMTGIGDYAIVRPSSPSSSSPGATSQGRGPSALWFILIGLLALLAVGIVAVRFTRRSNRRREPAHRD
jgi:hypothetical protein